MSKFHANLALLLIKKKKAKCNNRNNMVNALALAAKVTWAAGRYDYRAQADWWL